MWCGNAVVSQNVVRRTCRTLYTALGMYCTRWSKTAPYQCFHPRISKNSKDGVFGAHLSDTNVHSELHRSYRWGGMRRDIMRWTHGCLVCNTNSLGHALHAPLAPIPVAGPFNRVGVNVLQLPRPNN